MKTYYVYILTNWNNTVMYVGITNDIQRRVYEHKSKMISGFTQKYNVNKLVYYTETTDVRAAIQYEKKLKGLKREKKDAIVEDKNPSWRDLSDDWVKGEDPSLRSG